VTPSTRRWCRRRPWRCVPPSKRDEVPASLPKWEKKVIGAGTSHGVEPHGPSTRDVLVVHEDEQAGLRITQALNRCGYSAVPVAPDAIKPALALAAVRPCALILSCALEPRMMASLLSYAADRGTRSLLIGPAGTIPRLFEDYDFLPEPFEAGRLATALMIVLGRRRGCVHPAAIPTLALPGSRSFRH